MSIMSECEPAEEVEGDEMYTEFDHGLRFLSMSDVIGFRANDEGITTDTSEQQARTEALIEGALSRFFDRVSVDPDLPKLSRKEHIEFLERSLHYLSADYECLDASQPWLCYWMLHALKLLGHPISHHLATRIAQYLALCQDPEGGFGGGPGQLPHLAATYAAVMALACLSTQHAYRVINRRTLSRFLAECRNDDGSFSMHRGGEVDIRGAYCAASVVRLCNVFDDATFENTPQWVASCQTYEGGFSGTPGLEAHGGYTFCGLATLALLGHETLCDLDALMRWVACRQMSLEGGFSGRTNKLVDSCYAYWQGASFPVVHTVLAKNGCQYLSMERWLFQQEALQQYLLACCEREKGGFVDKPGKHRDFYHTCYALSGLSIAQNFHMGRTQRSRVVGHPLNQLELVHPIYNITVKCSVDALQYFSRLPLPSGADSSADEQFLDAEASPSQEAEAFKPREETDVKSDGDHH